MEGLMKKILFTILFLNAFNGLIAQKVSNPLKNYEISLLNLIEQDSTDFYATIDNNEFKFGTDFTGATFMNIAKHNGEIFLHPPGTGRLYSIRKINNQYEIKRIDSTIHSGVNFFSKSFFARDTLYNYGGLGFWGIRGIITFFSKQTNQWELIQSNTSIPSFFDYNQDAVVHINNSSTKPTMYLSNAYYYDKYPQSFEISSRDTCYAFDFNTKKWDALGKINPGLKKVLLGKSTLSFDMGNYLIVQSALEFYWLNFENNTYGKIDEKKNAEIRQIWLSLYNNEKQVDVTNFQFNIGQNIYLCKLEDKKTLYFKKIEFKDEFLDKTNVSPIYTDQLSLYQFLIQFISNNVQFIVSFFTLSIIVLIGLFIRKKKMKLPKEVVSILNNNFFNALTIVEKELIEELYQHHLKGEALSTKLINKIIGVQQKDTLTQNKSRSDYFIRINQKFKMATQHSEPLIIKHRDTADKRQYNYSINPHYIEDIEKLLHN